MYHDHDLLHDCLSTARIAIFFFVFLLPTADWPFWKIKLLLSEQLPQYFHEYLPNEPTHERTGWYLKLPVITWSLTAKNQNRNFGEVSNQGQNRLKKKLKSHISEKPQRYQKLKRKYMTWLHRESTSWFKLEEFAINLRNSFWSAITLNFELRF